MKSKNQFPTIHYAKMQKNSIKHFSRRLEINQYRRILHENFNFLKSFGRYEDFVRHYYIFLSIFWILQHFYVANKLITSAYNR